jgi:hypothetical protein
MEGEREREGGRERERERDSPREGKLSVHRPEPVGFIPR